MYAASRRTDFNPIVREINRQEFIYRKCTAPSSGAASGFVPAPSGPPPTTSGSGTPAVIERRPSFLSSGGTPTPTGDRNPGCDLIWSLLITYSKDAATFDRWIIKVHQYRDQCHGNAPALPPEVQLAVDCSIEKERIESLAKDPTKYTEYVHYANAYQTKCKATPPPMSPSVSAEAHQLMRCKTAFDNVVYYNDFNNKTAQYDLWAKKFRDGNCPGQLPPPFSTAAYTKQINCKFAMKSIVMMGKRPGQKSLFNQWVAQYNRLQCRTDIPSYGEIPPYTG